MTEPLWPLDNSFARLPDSFYARVNPTPVPAPRRLRLNEPLAEELGLPLDSLESEAGLSILSGNQVLEGMDPIAMVYAGQQFGNWVPQLGDGRAILLGEVIDRNGVRRDIQLKGAGPTPFSRNGDGRAALGPVIREYILSEAMAALGIPTTRALAMVETGESVLRERPLPGAILARVATSHVRVGTFQYFMSQGDVEARRVLADHLIGRAFPEIDLDRGEGGNRGDSGGSSSHEGGGEAAGVSGDAAIPHERYRRFLEAVIRRQADLIAGWMGVGFIHGVMNTDNVSIVGETLDYGPCAFLDRYRPDTVFSSIDRRGRYAYSKQPAIALWNLTRFAETLVPLLATTEYEAVEYAKGALAEFTSRFGANQAATFRRKLGLAGATETNDEIAVELLQTMAEQNADFTLTFRALSNGDPARAETLTKARDLFEDPLAFNLWADLWHQQLDIEGRDLNERQSEMRGANPAFIPRNHRVQQVIDAAEAGDYAKFDNLLTVVTDPFSDHRELSHLANAPEPHEVVQETFCGT